MSERSAILARVLIEERWAHVHTKRGVHLREMSTLSAEPVRNGGLGRPISSAVLGTRARAYRAEQRRRLEEAREAERERRVDAAMAAVVRADERVAASAGNGLSYAAAFDAYGRAEATLERRQSERPSVTRWMREGDEIDVALALLEAMRFVLDHERPDLMRSLEIVAPLEDFASRLGR